MNFYLKLQSQLSVALQEKQQLQTTIAEMKEQILLSSTELAKVSVEV